MLDRVENKAFQTDAEAARSALHDEAMRVNDRLPQKSRAESLNWREQEILSALNGGPGRPAMRIPEGTNQLVVVTSDNWSDPTGELQVFEREPAKGGGWHAVPGFTWPVNLGYNGMGWGTGGVIKTREVFIDGQLERTGGPIQRADGSLDTAGHVTMEGGGKSTAGLFKIGFAWGTALEAPAGTEIPYRHIDPFYRVIPQNGASFVDEQGHVLNGETVRELNPQTGKYERYDRQSRQYVEGSLSPQVMRSILENKQILQYHMVIKDTFDTNGNKLNGLLVKMNESEIKRGENGLPIFEKWMRVHYSSVDPNTGKPGPSGTLDTYATKNVFRESDYRWSDHPDQGRAVIGWDKSGNPILSKEIDNLYNIPVRVVDRLKGKYERLDPDTGKAVHLGFMEPAKLQSMVNNVETMTYEVYKWAIDVRQNVNQLKNGGSAIFLHDEYGNIEQGRPSGTAGCTSMSEKRMQQLMQHLQNNAMILQCPIDQLDTIVEALE